MWTRAAQLVGVAAASAVLAVLVFTRHGAGNLDDAFIVMVYVRNLLEHGVIEWNVGAGPVDGCTSMLDLLVKSALTWLTGAEVFEVCLRTTLALSILGGWIALGIGFAAGRTPGQRLGLGLAGAIVIATARPNGDAAAYLLEGPLYVCCTLAFIGLAATAGRFSTLRLTALVASGWLVSLARPEGGVLAAGVILAIGWQRREAPDARAWAAAAGVFALGVLAYYAWHVSYFGHWAPNTYYAKTSASRLDELRDGASYLLHYASSPIGALELLAVVAAPTALAVPLWRSPGGRWAFGVPAVAGLCMLLLVIPSGGDIYPGGRFLNVPVTLGLLALVLGSAHATGALRRVFVAALLGVGLVQLAHAAGAPRASVEYLLTLRETHGISDCDRFAARHLLRAGVSVGQTDFQRLKFIEPALHVVDFSGLNDPAIAHQPMHGRVREGKFTVEAVLRRKPDVFVWGWAFWNPVPITRSPLRAILDDPERAAALLTAEAQPTLPDLRSRLLAEYVPASLAVCEDSVGYFNVLVRREVAARLAHVGFVIGR